jgi:hypothetical protein
MLPMEGMYDERSRQSSNIKVICPKLERLRCQYHIWEGFVKYRYTTQMASGCAISISSSMKIHSGIWALLRVLLYIFRGLGFGITDGCDLWDMRLRWPRVAYIPNFIMIDSGFQVIISSLPLRFEELQFRYYSRGTPVGLRDDLKWYDMQTKLHDYQFQYARNIKVIKVIKVELSL